MDNRSLTTAPTPRGFVRELHDRNRTLFAVALVNAVLAAVFTVLLLIDSRTLLGRNIWTKPWKFATSIAVFSATMAWLLPSFSLTDRLERRVTAVIAVTMTLEITLITVQAARVVPSHFNQSTPLDTAIFGIMGTAITVNTLVVTYVLWRLVRDPPAFAPAYLWGVRAGLLVFVLASFEGWLMVANGAHSVGAPADSPGLPLLNWSMTGGDLRVAHFIGLHALQVVPLAGYLAVRWDRTAGRRALFVVGLVGAGYSALTGATFVQAVLGHPLIASLSVPPVGTLVAAGSLFGAPFWLLGRVSPE
jgi:hypothetical protein